MLAELLLDDARKLVGYGVCAIGTLVAIVDRGDCLENLWVHSRIVITCEAAPYFAFNHEINLRFVNARGDPNRNANGLNLLIEWHGRLALELACLLLD